MCGSVRNRSPDPAPACWLHAGDTSHSESRRTGSLAGARRGHAPCRRRDAVGACRPPPSRPRSGSLNRPTAPVCEDVAVRLATPCARPVTSSGARPVGDRDHATARFPASKATTPPVSHGPSTPHGDAPAPAIRRRSPATPIPAAAFDGVFRVIRPRVIQSGSLSVHDPPAPERSRRRADRDRLVGPAPCARPFRGDAHPSPERTNYRPRLRRRVRVDGPVRAADAAL